MQTDIHAFNEIRTHDPSVGASEYSSCLRPHSHCNRLVNHHEDVIQKLKIENVNYGGWSYGYFIFSHSAPHCFIVAYLYYLATAVSVVQKVLAWS
jgi:hypothetical protein